jgi:hypothetical protein
MPADDITISLALPGFKVTQPTSEPDGDVWKPSIGSNAKPTALSST